MRSHMHLVIRERVLILDEYRQAFKSQYKLLAVLEIIFNFDTIKDVLS